MESRTPRPSPTGTDALLAQSAWVRRLAHKLLDDAHLAEDVAQDALAAALERPAATSPANLRRWLAGVTRQLAWRARSRRSEQRAREARAARAEAGDGGPSAAERLRLHQRLAAAVLELDEPYRTTLVQRFFDELAPREIARRAGLAPEAVRQRLSRGLAMLRGRLDGEFDGGRSAWCGALVALLASGPDPRFAIPLAEVVLMSSKKIGIAALVAAAGASWWWIGSSEPQLVAPLGDSGADATVARPADDDESAAAPAVETVAHGREALVESAPTQAVAKLELLVRTSAGEPLAADVFVFDGAALLAQTRGGVDGRVELDSRPTPGTVVARAADRPPALLALSELAGEHVVTIAEGLSLSGMLIEDGAFPSSRLRMRLYTNGDPFEELSEPVRETLREAGLWDDFTITEADEQGAFRFSSLPAGWSGTLKLPRTHWFADDPAWGSISAGDDDVLLVPTAGDLGALAITRLPVVSGRVVWADGSGPVPLTSICVYGKFDDGSNSPSISFLAEEDGTFEQGLYSGASDDNLIWRDPARRPRLAEVRLDVGSNGESLDRTIQLSGAELGDGDVGDIVVERGRLGHFVVVDSAGEPIEGALAFADTLSKPTDALGRGRLTGLEPDVDGALVGAVGYRILQAPLAAGGTLDDPFEFTLEPGNALELRFADEDGRVPSGLTVRVASERPLFEAARGWGPTSLHYALFVTPWFGASWSDDGGEVSYKLDSEGRVSLMWLNPGVPLQVDVLNRLGGSLCSVELVTPGIGEVVERELLVAGGSFALSGSVRDVAGAVLANAKVTLQTGRRRVSARTDGEGVFELADLYPRAEPVAIEASLPGYATRRRAGLELSAETRLDPFVLELGQRVTVRVVDDSGAPIERHVTALAPGHAAVRSKDLEPGVGELLDLPPGRVTLTVEYGRRTHRLEHDTSNPEARFVLPPHGTLDLRPPQGVVAGERESLRGRLRAPADPEFDATLFFDDEGERSSGEIPLLPGRYEASVERVVRVDGERVAQPIEGLWVVEVRAGETTRVTLGE